jgi:hypothetical protein
LFLESWRFRPEFRSSSLRPLKKYFEYFDPKNLFLDWSFGVIKNVGMDPDPDPEKSPDPDPQHLS